MKYPYPGHIAVVWVKLGVEKSTFGILVMLKWTVCAPIVYNFVSGTCTNLICVKLDYGSSVLGPILQGKTYILTLNFVTNLLEIASRSRDNILSLRRNAGLVCPQKIV